MTYKEIKNILSDAGVPDFNNDAFALIEHFCGISRADILCGSRGGEVDYTSEELASAVRLRAKRYPLQYIIGKRLFYNELYTVNANCLIPRNETELLVEKAVSMLPRGGKFLDLCTGSGCIAISTLASRPDCTCVAAELYPETAQIAKENAGFNGVGDRLNIRICDVADDKTITDGEKFDAVLSNPPYIETDDLKLLAPELSYEPKAALDGGADGMYFCRLIIEKYKNHLKDGGFMLIEHGAEQGDDMRGVAEANGLACEIIKDYAGLDRIAFIRRK